MTPCYRGRRHPSEDTQLVDSVREAVATVSPIRFAITRDCEINATAVNVITSLEPRPISLPLLIRLAWSHVRL